MIAESRINEIALAMGTDENRIKALVELSPEEAAAELNKQGYNFTTEEIIDFGAYIVNTTKAKDEVDEEMLEQVSGGSVTAAVFVAGVIIGMVANKKGWW